jgi:hypothetical protein
MTAGLILFAQALIGLSFFLSCLQEKERRASLFAGLQLLVMLLLLTLFLYLNGIGFFRTGLGIILLIAGLIVLSSAFSSCEESSQSQGPAMPGPDHRRVRRFDEEIVLPGTGLSVSRNTSFASTRN